jgi:hypothetical protein
VEGTRKPPLALLSEERYFQGIKLGFDRPLQHLRAGAPRYKGARPNLCGRAFILRDMPSRSLLARTFSPVPTYIFDKGILFLALFASFSFIIGIFFVYLHPQSARSAKTYCSIVLSNCDLGKN